MYCVFLKFVAVCINLDIIVAGKRDLYMVMDLNFFFAFTHLYIKKLNYPVCPSV